MMKIRFSTQSIPPFSWRKTLNLPTTTLPIRMDYRLIEQRYKERCTKELYEWQVRKRNKTKEQRKLNSRKKSLLERGRTIHTYDRRRIS
jgi:hypothetical protein